MNVERKAALSCVYESYWDMLPPEIQEYILKFKISQEQINQEREERMSKLRLEISMYARVKAKWGWGHVRCNASRLRCKKCDVYHTSRVYGCYVDTANVKKQAFLGHGLGEALMRVDDVKRSCVPYFLGPYCVSMTPNVLIF